RVHSAHTPAQVGVVLLLRENHPAERRPDLHGDAVWIEIGGREPRIVEREASGRDGELRKTVESLVASPLHEVGRLEILDLGGDMAAKGGGIEATDPAHGGCTSLQALPQGGRPRTDGSYASDAGDGD